MQDFGGIGTVYGAEEDPYKEDQISVLVSKETPGPKKKFTVSQGLAHISSIPLSGIISIAMVNDQHDYNRPFYIVWRGSEDKFYVYGTGEEVLPGDDATKSVFEKLKKKAKMAGQDK